MQIALIRGSADMGAGSDGLPADLKQFLLTPFHNGVSIAEPHQVAAANMHTHYIAAICDTTVRELSNVIQLP